MPGSRHVSVPLTCSVPVYARRAACAARDTNRCRKTMTLWQDALHILGLKNLPYVRLTSQTGFLYQSLLRSFRTLHCLGSYRLPIEMALINKSHSVSSCISTYLVGNQCDSASLKGEHK
ncbi:hypothetical protein NDU88_003000 [Pleurodeles waltl]|uniref:Uncharacterized protein n=1 Tax=Pleurodeles waltl TaxID=8319 RepID=A0AAV7QBN3_PLEWA|nr:hypothetical protein NDU88_003000 [Pleurodeles waltl]